MPSSSSSRKFPWETALLALLGLFGGVLLAGLLAPMLRVHLVDQPGPSSADVAFLQGMIPHHEQALEMTALAEDRAEDPELVALADQMDRVQSQEVTLMESMLESWGEPRDPLFPPQHSHESLGMASGADMETLASLSGEDFDALFLSLMIDHHRGALQMGDHHAGEDALPEVSDLSRAIRSGQLVEISRMENLQR